MGDLFGEQVQCNVFDGVSGEVALTAGGGRRGLPFVPGRFEEVAMVCHPDKKYKSVSKFGL